MLLAALLASLAAAIPAGFVDPPGNDLLLHGQMVAGAADALRAQGWTAFQDPWVVGGNGGYPLLHVYPRLFHQLAAGFSVLTGVGPYQAAGLLMALCALLIPGACYVGARWLGLTVERAGLAALAAATLQCVDPFGHAPLAYSFDGAGLGPQALGGVLAALAVPALLAVTRAPSEGPLAGWSRGRRLALAAVLLSLVVRAHLVAGWVAPLLAGVLVLAMGRRALGARLGWLVVAGVGAAALAAGFLVPFATDLWAVNDSAMEGAGRSYGLGVVLRGVLGGGFLDGGRPGVWTVALALALVGARRAQSPVARPLAAGLVVMVLLMAGRATFGGWMDSVPLLGRFHDQRYLLGVHLVVPWLIASAAPDGLRWLVSKTGAAGPWVAQAAPVGLGIAFLLAGGAGAEQLGTANAAQQEFAAWRGAIDGVAQEASALPGAVAARFDDELVASTTPMSWLARSGVKTVGKPLHHYSHGYEVGAWLAAHPGEVAPESAAALGLAGLVRRDAGAYSLQRLGGEWPEVSVARADLLMSSSGSSLDGVALAWWGSGAWRVRQHIAVALGGRELGGEFMRRGTIEAPDGSLLAGLPPAKGGAVLDGGLPIRGVGERRIRARADEPGQWLKVAMSWHPGLRATLDGAEAEVALLVPGHVGVRLPPGEHEVTLSWEVPAVRGAWAAGNVFAVLALGLFAVGRRRRDPVAG